MHGDRDVPKIGALVENGGHAHVEQAAQDRRIGEHRQHHDADVRPHRTNAPDHRHAVGLVALRHGVIGDDDVAGMVGEGVEQGIGIVGAGDHVVAMRLEDGFDPATTTG